MLTTNGGLHIKRYMAGYVPAIAQSIAFGLGGKAESVSDFKLQFEVGREDITLTSFDFVNNKLIFKAPVPDDFAGTIYEVALYSTPQDIVAADFGSRMITTFDSATEDWADVSTAAVATFVTTARIGSDALSHTPAASTTKTDSLGDVTLDLSGYSAADKFVLAYNIGNANTTNIKVLFLTDAANYYTITITSPAAGYNITEVAKGSATVTGVPSWGNITEIRIATTSGAGGASAVYYDGLRIDDVDTTNPDYVMVSRELLATPFVKVDGKTQEIEFSLGVTV